MKQIWVIYFILFIIIIWRFDPYYARIDFSRQNMTSVD